MRSCGWPGRRPGRIVRESDDSGPGATAIPGDSVLDSERKEISLRFPTIKNLQLLAGTAAAAELLAAFHERPVPTIRPRVLMVDGRPVPVIPGDPRWY